MAISSRTKCTSSNEALVSYEKFAFHPHTQKEKQTQLPFWSTYYNSIMNDDEFGQKSDVL
ncbi:hypothetical protein WN51_07476 [Melipona quadrifasciata]|uniref:Uncharacterized protein n=1 Tax=Melipona quadrifasciata TaxID=166423 RepID=A0A0M9A755_9HYME|nr:hypothetical protein WN51_07476 [Melipona quadrifasciata]